MVDFLSTINAPLAIAALLAGVSLQGFAGFGSGLVCVPLLLAAGASLPQALMCYYPLAWVQVVLNVLPRREHVDWSLARRWVPWATGGIVLGVAFGSWLCGVVSPAAIKALVGAVICAFFLLRFMPQRQVSTVGPRRTAGAALCSGLLSGSVGMGGPPMVMWLIALGRSGIQMRVMIWTLVIFSVPCTLTTVVAFNGPELLWCSLLALCLAPLAWLGSELAARLGDRLGTDWTRRIAWTLLLVIALQALATPLVGLLAS